MIILTIVEFFQTLTFADTLFIKYLNGVSEWYYAIGPKKNYDSFTSQFKGEIEREKKVKKREKEEKN